uniref:Uncharacterized protein n=1 Tax=Physcomitrium patens TaxID=3218 RepID=A0A2K1KZF3_PHYPA|nr:hypothetical protein PHYPA_001976 [Physcomitrium patens]
MATEMDVIYGTCDPVMSRPSLAVESITACPSDVDVDVVYFMVNVRDLPGLLGEIARPAKRRIHVRDLEYFQTWLHVISDPVLVKVNAGDTAGERQLHKRAICRELRRNHRLALALSNSSMVLSKSQVNVPVRAMVDALHACGHVECRVGFFGMKWAFPKAQPKIDLFVEYHMILHGTTTVVARNQFDIGIVVPTRTVHIFGFGESQFRLHRRFRKADVYEMFNTRKLGSLEFCIHGCERIGKIKIYQELCHEVVAAIPKDNLDDVPKTMRTMRTRVEQVANLSRAWEQYDGNDLKECLLGTRIEITILRVHTIAEAYRICLALDVLNLGGIEKMLGGTFLVRHISIDEVLGSLRSKVQQLQGLVQGGNDTKPSIRMRSALTEARQALGWSGKNMKRQLQEAREWRQAMVAQNKENERPLYQYDGWKLDEEGIRPLIVDFLHNASWQYHSRSKDLDPHPIMLQKIEGGGYWKKDGVYVDRVGGARFFINKYGQNWRRYVKARP